MPSPAKGDVLTATDNMMGLIDTIEKEKKEDSVRKKQAQHLRDKYGDKTKTPAPKGGE